MKRRLYGIRDRHFPALCLMICLAALVTGCGGKEAVHTSAEAQETQNGDTTRQVELLKPEQTSAAMAQMEIDEETRKELTAQLLEENELDTSVLESRRRTKGCTLNCLKALRKQRTGKECMSPEDIPSMLPRSIPLPANRIFPCSL